jgi:SAM-dependent methyltransferase
VTESGDRERLRQTFDHVAQHYDRARPEYPEALFDELIAVTRLPRGARLLEVGSATGKATLPLAKRGFDITCIELGADLAAVARQRLAGFPNVQVIRSDFDTWTPPGRRFDLVFAATAWHWLDPATRYQRAAAALVPRGHLAIWSATHAFPDGGDPFFLEIQEVYDEIGEGLPVGSSRPRPDEIEEVDLESDSGGLFRRVGARVFDWETVHDADSYIALLNTFSGHIAMQPWQRDRLYSEIRRRLAARPDGRLRRHWGAVLEIARLAA